jgi:hypothetical protein
LSSNDDEEEMRMEKKEKPLEKTTAKELREMALGLPGVHGVHAMKKEELIAAIRKAKGITEPEPKKEKVVVAKKEKVVLTVAQLKQKVRELRLKKEEALQQRNLKMAKIFRKQISRLKKKTRRAA